LLKQLFTRIYFADDAVNREDPVLMLVPEEGPETLMAYCDPAAPVVGASRFIFKGNRNRVL
jgi:protocatechuate 3,4-dioxygenase beta subunit